MRADPKSIKKTVMVSVFFALSGSVLEKAAHRTLMKLTPCHCDRPVLMGWSVRLFGL